MMELSINNNDDLIAFINAINGQYGYLCFDEVFNYEAFKLIHKFYNNYDATHGWFLNLYDDCISFTETIENTIEIPWSNIHFTQEDFVKRILDYLFLQYNDFRTCARKKTTQEMTTANMVNKVEAYSSATSSTIYNGTLTFSVGDDTTYATKKEENNNMMNFNFDFGPINSNDKVSYSLYGMAIKNADGKFVCLRDGDIVDVSGFTFDDMAKFLYKIPVAIKDIATGDIVIHNKKPCFVQGFAENSGNPVVIDIYNGEEKTILPTKNMFGFDFVTKIVPLFDFAQGKADKDNPFGNLMPLMMMQSMNGCGNDDMSKFFMMSMMMGGVNPFAALTK